MACLLKAPRVLGIIPARGGSKGVPRKNLQPVAGRPLIAYAIEAARKSRHLSDVVTSTDDAEIAAAAARLGSEVLRRPVALAADDTPMVPVVLHALEVLEPARGRYDYVAVLQPTAPLRTVEDIDAALTVLLESGGDSVVSVCRVEDQHPARMYRIVEGRLVPYEEEPPNRLRQTLVPVYHRNGAVYACRRALLEASGTLIGLDARPYLMPRERSVNIDDAIDLALADLLLRRGQGAADDLA